MPNPILSPRSRVAAATADKLLKCYAKRMPPAEAAQRIGLSRNTVYDQYARIRWRLIEVGYYRDAALSKDEAGLSDAAKQQLTRRRGLTAEDVYAHAAEVIEWQDEWQPGTVLRHLRKIIELTGPIDLPLELTDLQMAVVQAYVRYARTKLIHDRVAQNSGKEEKQRPFAERTRLATDNEWRAYRTAIKRLERSRSSWPDK